MSLRRGAQPRCLSFGFAFDYELFTRLIVRELLSSFSHSALHRVASSLSLSILLFFHSFSLSLADSSQVEALRGRVESPYPRTTSAVFHSPQPPTPRGEAAHPPFCVSERTPVRSGTLFCNIVLLEPRNAASRVCGKY